jgi:hypothetical protein
MEDSKDERVFYLCQDCAKDIFLKKIIKDNCLDTNICTICLDSKLAVNISHNQEIKNLTRFLIRYHFPEYIYNIHWGGEALPALFYNENPIISHQF